MWLCPECGCEIPDEEVRGRCPRCGHRYLFKKRKPAVKKVRAW